MGSVEAEAFALAIGVAGLHGDDIEFGNGVGGHGFGGLGDGSSGGLGGDVLEVEGVGLGALG